jgi:hemerythrin superfamily protein
MSWTHAKSTDAIEILKRDHVAVAVLFREFADADSDEEREDLATRICQMLTVHSLCEEEHLYPAAQEIIDDDLVHRAEIEHGSIKELIDRLEATSPSDEAYSAIVMVLADYVEHHVNEEEQELFPQLQAGNIDLEAIGAAILARKDELAMQFSTIDGPGEDEDDDDEEDIYTRHTPVSPRRDTLRLPQPR